MHRLRVLAASLLTAVLCVGGATGVATASPRADATGLPNDPKASGYIGLCDQAGHNVVSGSINTTPFVWKAVASTPPPKAYQGAGQNAVLSIYQPRPDTRPSEWSGGTLTAASFYTNAQHPAVQATYLDLSLKQFIQNAPAEINGLYVLRISWGKRDYGLYSASYPTTTIQVRGSQWHVVSGGTVDCSSATRGTSLEQLTGVATKQDITPRSPAAGQSTAPAGTPRAITVAPSAGGSGTAVAAGADGADSSDQASGTAAASAASDSSESGLGWLPWTLGAVVLLLALALFVVTRRRPRPASLAPHSDPNSKG